MDKRSSSKKEHDFAITAFRVVQEAIAEADSIQANIIQADQIPEGKNPHAVALGYLGGKKGGKARATKLTSEQRSEIARKAATARWSKRQPSR